MEKSLASRARRAAAVLFLALAALGHADLGPERPAIHLASPRDFETYRAGIRVEGQVRDNVSGATSIAGLHSLRWELLGTGLDDDVDYDGEGRFAFSIAAPAGRVGLLLKLTAVDLNGESTSESVALLRERAPLSLSLSSPADGSYYRERTALSGRFEGDLSEVQALEWSIDGTGLRGPLPLEADGSFSGSIDTSALAGEATVRVMAVARAGRALEALAVLRDGVSAPSIDLTEPSSGDSYGESVAVSGRVSLAGGPATLSWRIPGSDRGGPVALGPEGSFSFSAPTQGLDGPCTIELSSKALNGREVSRSVVLSEESREILLELDRPEDGGTYGEQILLAGRAGTPLGSAWSTRWVESLRYEVRGALSLQGQIPLDGSTGAFAQALPAGDLRGGAIVRLVVRGTTGSVVERTLTLTQSPASTRRQPAATVTAETPAARPSLLLYAPLADSLYKGSVRIEGRLADGLDQLSVAARFPKLEWEILGTGRAGSISVEPNGLFAGSASTEELRDAQLLRIVAVHDGGEELSRIVVLQEDGAGPWLEVAEPAPGAAYRQSLLLRGTARDTAGSPESAVEVGALSYRIDGETGAQGEATVDPATGAFSVEIDTSDLRGRRSLVVTAVDRNGYETARTIPLSDGLSEPVISLEAPEPESPYGAFLVVRGSVTLGGEVRTDEIASVAISVASSGYELASAPYAAPAGVAGDGTFEAAIPAGGFHGPQKLTVTATATNGKAASVAVSVLQGDSDIPGMEAIEEDGAVLLRWPRVPFASRYDLLTIEGAELVTREGVSSPLRVADLTNGLRYTFRLRATLSTGAEIWSADVPAIPLSPRTLEPHVQGEYRRIRLWWSRIAGAQGYEIWRSLDAAAEASLLAETTELVYLDVEVDYGRRYSYRIKPAGIGRTLSDAAAAETTAFPAERFALEATLPLEKGVQSLAVDRSYAYLACGPEGLVVAEVRDAIHPQVLARLPMADARGVALATLADGKRYAFVADGELGLAVLDISVPAGPVVIGNRVTADARSVALLSDRDTRLAYVADGDSGLKVVDISVARRPERLASLQVGNLRALCLRLPYLYAVGAEGLVAFDLRDPASPVEISTTRIAGCRGVVAEARGGSLYLYVARGEAGLAILDATDPRSIRLVGGYDTPLAAAVAASSHLYIADERDGILVIDVTDPGGPFQFDAVDLGGVRDLAIVDTPAGQQFAYAACPDGLRIVQILVHGRSLELGSFATGDRGYRIELSALGTDGLYACVADHARGVHLERLEAVGSPDFHGSGITLPALYAYDTAVAQIGDAWYVLVADADGGLKIFDVSSSPPRLAGSAFAADARSVTTFCPDTGFTLALLTDRRDGLRVYDVSRPDAPRQIALLPLAGALDAAYAGGKALVGSPDGVALVDLGEPGSPAILGKLQGIRVKRVEALDAEAQLFAAVTSQGIVTIDCSAPEAPRLVSSYATAFGEDFAVPERGTQTWRLAVAEGYRGISVLEPDVTGAIRRVSACPGVLAVGIATWHAEDGRDFAYAVDTARVWQIEILIPRWLSAATGAPPGALDAPQSSQ